MTNRSNGEGKDRRKRRGKFVYTLFLSFLLVATIPLLLSAWRFISSNREWLVRNQRVMQVQSGKHISSEIGAYLESCSRDILLVTELLETKGSPVEFQQEVASPEFDSFLKKLVSGSYFTQIHVLNTEGLGVQASLGALPFESLLESVLRTTLDQPDLIVTPALGSGSRPEGLVFSKRIRSGSRKLGAVLGLLSLEPLAGKIQELSSDYEIFVVDTEGRIILSNQIEKGSALEGEILDQIKDLSGQVVRNIGYTPPSGKKKIATLMSASQNLGWFVVVQADEDVTYFPVQQVLNSTSVVLVLASVLAAFSGWIVSRHISRPVRQLAASSESLAAGNFEERVQIQSQNELGDLAEHFNSMAARIQGYVEELKAAVQSNRQLFLEAVQTVAAAIDEKDPYTKGHSERVTHYAVIVAEELGLKPEEVENIRVAALLHDVGKIGVPDEILQKPISLDSKEFEIMKQHPVKGARIIGQISQLQDVIPGILYHHEKVDGTGYPEGLNGAQIPIQAKIISVVDAFDALTTHRPYQTAMTLESALQRVESFVGTRYDTGVVEALKAAVDKKRIKLRRTTPKDLAMSPGRRAV